MLQDIQQSNKMEEGFMILGWLAYSHRPLTLSEIVELPAFDVGDAEIRQG